MNKNITHEQPNKIFRAYSINEIASIMGIGKTKTRELLIEDVLPVTKIGKQYFTSYQKIQDFLEVNIGKNCIDKRFIEGASENSLCRFTSLFYDIYS